MKKIILNALAVAAGCALYALAFSLFLKPCRIAPGGISGLALIINVLTGFPTGLAIIALNIPLAAASFMRLGRRFVLATAAATVLSSLLIDLTSSLPPVTDDPLLAALYGGAALGAGLGTVFAGGATTGGSDIISRLLRLRFPHLRIGQLLFAVDALIITLSAFVFRDINRALYAAIALYVSSVVIDAVVYRFDNAVMTFIISRKPDDIAGMITKRLSRGVTRLSGRGGYTDSPRDVLLCAVKHSELPELREAASAIDPSVFFIAADAHQVIGDGFLSPPGS